MGIPNENVRDRVSRSLLPADRDARRIGAALRFPPHPPSHLHGGLGALHPASDRRAKELPPFARRASPRASPRDPPARRARFARPRASDPPSPRRILHDDWPTHIHAWVVFELGLAVLESAFGIWGAIIDARDSTFYERRTETFLLLDIVLLVMNLATSVTGAVYWRHGSDESKILFDCVVILSWIALGVLAVTTAQDKVKAGSD